MIVSDARRAANRKNAQKSTGPRTVEGKSASRRNALKHGLAAETIGPADPTLHRARSLALAGGVEPGSAWVSWLVAEVATITLRLDLIKEMDGRHRQLAALQARTTWDDDRRVEAETLGARLARDPSRVVAQLRQTPHGCDWLLARWIAVLDRANRSLKPPLAPRTSEQRLLPLLLLGTPQEAIPAASDLPAADPWSCGPAVVRADIEVAREAIAELRIHRVRVAAYDAARRQLAESGLAGDATAELRRLRRYESTLHRRLRWCLEQTEPAATWAGPPTANRLDSLPGVAPAPPSVTTSVAAPPPPSAPTPVGEPPAPAAPADLPGPAPAGAPRADEPARIPANEPARGPANPLPAEVNPRVAARLRQAEARRSSKQRRLERRRA